MSISNTLGSVTRRRPMLVAALFYVLIAVLMTWPAISHLNTQIIGTGGDPWQSMWRFNDTAKNLTQAWTSGSFGQFITQEFLGSGPDRLVNLSVWPWLPLHFLFEEPVAYNLVWLISFVLSGFGMYLLVRYILQSTQTEDKERGYSYDLAATLAGLFYMWLPYHVAHGLGHFGALQTQWLPLCILVFAKWIKKPTFITTIGLGILLTIQAWTEHHYILWLGILVVWYLCIEWRKIASYFKDKKHLIWVTALFILAVVGILLPYLPTVHLATQTNSSLVLGQQQTIRFSADPFAYIVPASFHTIWGRFVEVLYSSAFTGNVAESTEFVGIIPLLLIIFFRHSIPRRQKIFWGGTALIFFVISLGPRLHFLGMVTPIRLPYAILDKLPGLSSVRAIARAGVMVGLSMSILLAWVAYRQIKRSANYLILGALILLEFLCLPIPSQSSVLSPIYAAVKNIPGQTIIELPAATNYISASKALYASGVHGKEVMGSIALERALDEEDLRYVKSLPGIRQLLYLRTTDIKEDRPEFFNQPLAATITETIKWSKTSAVIIHTDSLSQWQLLVIKDFLENQLGLHAQTFDDDLLYDTSNLNLPNDGVFLTRGDGWSNVGYDRKRNSVFAEIERQASINLVNIKPNPVTINLSWTGDSESGNSFTVTQDNKEAGEFTVIKGETVSIPLTLTPGAHSLTINNRLPDKIIVREPRLTVAETNAQ